MANVFSERIAHLNRNAGKTYQEMAVDCDFQRSVTWWNKVRWNEIKVPPEPGLYPHLARALEVPERRVAEMVAEQWCGVTPNDSVPKHLRHLVAVLRGVDPDDLPVLVDLAQLLSEKRGTQRLLKAFEPRLNAEWDEWQNLPEDELDERIKRLTGSADE